MNIKDKELIKFCKYIYKTMGSPCDYCPTDEHMFVYCGDKCDSDIINYSEKYKCWLKVFAMVNDIEGDIE